MNSCQYLYPDFRLLVMSKSPALGTVKTRMQPALTEEESLQLHIDLSAYCLKQWQESLLCPLDLWVAGDVGLYQEKILQDFDCEFSVKQQQGANLGERMLHAVKQSLQESSVKGVVLAGTDCPFIDKAYLQKTLETLSHQQGVVIGPANDGGYVLLGMASAYTELFVDVEWGSDTVFEITEQRVKALNVNYHRMPSLSDIDNPDDLRLLNALPGSLLNSSKL